VVKSDHVVMRVYPINDVARNSLVTWLEF